MQRQKKWRAGGEKPRFFLGGAEGGGVTGVAIDMGAV